MIWEVERRCAGNLALPARCSESSSVASFVTASGKPAPVAKSTTPTGYHYPTGWLMARSVFAGLRGSGLAGAAAGDGNAMASTSSIVST